VPVIVSAPSTTEGAAETFKALALGAFDFVAKPHDAASAHMEAIAEDLISKIKVASRSKMRNGPPTVFLDRPKPNKTGARTRREPTKLVAIGISTGAPMRSSIFWRNCRETFPEALLWCSICRKGSRKCFPAG